MKTQWTVSGAGWQESILADSDENAMEIATRAVENLLNSNKKASFGAVLEVKNELMNEDQYLYVYTPRILANAGALDLATKLEAICNKLSDADFDEERS